MGDTERASEIENNDCYGCLAFDNCLSGIVEGRLNKCMYYDQLQKQFNECIDKLNKLGNENPISEEEAKALIYYAATSSMEEHHEI